VLTPPRPRPVNRPEQQNKDRQKNDDQFGLRMTNLVNGEGDHARKKQA